MTSSPPQSHLHSEVSDIKNSNNNNSISLVNFAQTSSSSTEHFEDLDPYSAVPLSSLYPRNLDPNSSLADFQSAFSNESLVQIQAFLDANHSWVESSTNETSTFPLWNMTSIVLPPGVREAVMSLKKDFDGGILSGKGFRWKLWKLWTTLNSEGVVMGSATRGERHGFVSTKLDVAASTLGTEIPTTVESHVEIQDFPGDKLTGRRRRRSLMGRRRLLETSSWTRRRLLDTYADSLRHTNRVLNRAFGYVARKVPAHMPHMAQKSVLHNFQKRFPEEIRETSSHRFRSPNDLQFSFAYFYYLMSEMKNVSSIVEGYFAELDINKDEVLSDREIRILAVKILPTPLTGESLELMENILINCSSVETKDPHPNTKTPSVKYYNPKMPLITRQLFLNCSILMEKLQKHFEAEKKTNWHFEIVGEDDVAFKMLNSNASEVVKKLDDIRKHPKKFICLNDNLDHESKEAKIVKMLIHDFYESFFPFPSQFELQSGLRNKFTHVWELKQWEEKRENAEVYVFVALVILLMIAVGSFVYDNCRCWRGGRNQSDRV